jgi:hypothetical protein
LSETDKKQFYFSNFCLESVLVSVSIGCFSS